MDDYKTTCPKCGAEDQLVVVAFTAATAIPLGPNGFATEDAKFFHTSDEQVECRACDARMPLTELMT